MNDAPMIPSHQESFAIPPKAPITLSSLTRWSWRFLGEMENIFSVLSALRLRINWGRPTAAVDLWRRRGGRPDGSAPTRRILAFRKFASRVN